MLKGGGGWCPKGREDREDEDRGGNEYLLALGVTCMRLVRSLREKLGMPEDFHMKPKFPVTFHFLGHCAYQYF